MTVGEELRDARAGLQEAMEALHAASNLRPADFSLEALRRVVDVRSAALDWVLFANQRLADAQAAVARGES